ncbi:MAG: ribosomal protein S18-alanine N-acetyltransferase [Thermoleophilia bacterium]|nr:ribosomal protein S18-alanine N-acetyltransferase [Thermoleophilia bacterium]
MAVNEPSATIRLMNSKDLPDVETIERMSFSCPWTRSMFQAELDQPLSVHLVCTSQKGEVVGFLVGRKYPETWHLLDLAVHPEWRRRGIGGELLDAFLNEADANLVSVVLEVREGNVPARSLYESRGFRSVGVRRGYYPDTGEDAIVMMRFPSGEKDIGDGYC